MILNASSLRNSVILVLLLTLCLAWVSVGQRDENALIVYCAHDLVFAEKILKDFEAETGIKVLVVGDTEATKSLGLVQRLIREKDHPRCDVFWNNLLLGTMDLEQQGVLDPYKGSGYARIPEKFKDEQGLWVGFAGRLRVWIVNTKILPAESMAIEEKSTADDLSRMAIAMPMYGTTLSHFSVIWDQLGAEGAQKWYRQLQQRNCRIVQGNATVKNLVAEGVCDLGWTDTDDFFVGQDAEAPVGMLPIRVEEKTICIPNSVSMIRGTKRREAAGKLIDYLLSEEVELALANSTSRQIPLGPVPVEKLSEDVRPLVVWAQESVDMRDYLEARTACLHWIQEEAKK